MNGTVANTDLDWYRFLLGRQEEACTAGREGLDEVNFWKPSGRMVFRALQPGEPFFFRLKTPHNAIVGFGFFARFSRLPEWLAWEAFGEMNGTPDLATLQARAQFYRRRNRVEDQGLREVGCILVTQPVFFKEDDWVGQPGDWAPNIVANKGYNVSDGEGRRIFDECLDRWRSQRAPHDGPSISEPRYGDPVLVKPRLGQGTFRIAVTDAYDRACAVTEEHSLPVLEAAHIRPFAQEGPHDVSNGILLRTDVHRLFDRGYVTVDRDHRFVVSRRLQDDWRNGKTYYDMEGRRIHLPRDAASQPDPHLLEWHNDHVYLG